MQLINHSAAMALLKQGRCGSSISLVRRVASDKQRAAIGAWAGKVLPTPSLATLRDLVKRAEASASLTEPYTVVELSIPSHETLSGMREVLQLEGRDFGWGVL